MTEITETEARLLEAYGPLEMARLIESLSNELAWIAAFAQIRSEDDSKTFARVNRGALRTIARRTRAASELTGMSDMDMGRAMPQAARAGRAPHRALLHGLGHTAPIAIAALNVAYFGAQLARAL